MPKHTNSHRAEGRPAATDDVMHGVMHYAMHDARHYVRTNPLEEGLGEAHQRDLLLEKVGVLGRVRVWVRVGV